MFKELFLASIISTSISVKTSNDDTKPNDYEFMIMSEKNANRYSYYIKRDWERELGEKYIDNVIKVKYITPKNIYSGLDLIDKESKGIDYLTLNGGYKFDNGVQSGLSIKTGNNASILASIAYDKSIETDKTTYLFSTAIKSNLNNDHIYNFNIDVKRWITERVNLFVLGKYIFFDKKEDFQFKVGAGVKF